MRVIFAIPHFYRATGKGGHGSTLSPPSIRLQAVRRCIFALHELFGQEQLITNIADLTSEEANKGTRASELKIVLCTSRNDHLISELDFPPSLITHHETKSHPPLLGFECHRILSESLDAFDFFCYLEDDLILHDPWLFLKLHHLVEAAGSNSVFQPHRYEAPHRSRVSKAYIDGALPLSLLSPYKTLQSKSDLSYSLLGSRCQFQIAKNPHSGCFFLNAEQMRRWVASSNFLDLDVSFVGPLESAATLGLIKNFSVYKPAADVASFLEIEHFGTGGSANIGVEIAFPKS